MASFSAFVSFNYAVLWLLLFSHLPLVGSVCEICFGGGAADGCVGASDTCPWGTAIAANVAAITAGLGGTLTVAKVLPAKVTRILSKPILDAISALSSRVAPGSTYDPDGKTPNQIAKAVKLGLFQRDEAMDHVRDLMAEVDDDDEHAPTKLKKLENLQADIRSCNVLVNTDSSIEGALLFILFKLSKVICATHRGSTSFDLCGDCDASSSSSGSSSANG